jgi:hypothetical protein
MVSKYIRMQWAGFIVWDAAAPLSHSQVARALDLPGDGVISAGFVERQGAALVCTGESTSLGMKALPDDTKHLQAQMGFFGGMATA